MSVEMGEEDLTGSARPAAFDPGEPAFAGQGAGRRDRLFEGACSLLVVHKVAETFVEAARARRPPLGTSDPTAQLRHLHAGKAPRKRRIRRIEEMMPFVKDVA